MTKQEIEKELTELENRLKVLREKLQETDAISEGFTPGRFWSVDGVLYILSMTEGGKFNFHGIHPGSNRYFDACTLEELKKKVMNRNSDKQYNCHFKPITKKEAIVLIDRDYARFDE